MNRADHLEVLEQVEGQLTELLDVTAGVSEYQEIAYRVALHDAVDAVKRARGQLGRIAT